MLRLSYKRWFTVDAYAGPGLYQFIDQRIDWLVQPLLETWLQGQLPKQADQGLQVIFALAVEGHFGEIIVQRVRFAVVPILNIEFNVPLAES